MNFHCTKKKEWWVDNLQSNDDTLLVGQNTCNTISVDKSSSIENWVDEKD